MTTHKGRTEAAYINLAFSTFLFSTWGWALLEMQLVKVVAPLAIHLLASTLGVLLSALTFRRCRLWWPTFNNARTAAKPSRDLYRPRDLGSCLLLMTIGGVVAAAMNYGSITLFILCAGAVSLVPWAKLAFCRQRFFVSWAMLTAGATVTMLAGSHSAPLLYPLSAWALWLIAVMELLATIGGARSPALRLNPILKTKSAGSTSTDDGKINESA